MLLYCRLACYNNYIGAGKNKARENDMTKYIKNHTKYILEQMQSGCLSEKILDYHHMQIAYLQHERLVHLIVLCLFTLLFAGVFAFFYFASTYVSFILMIIFAVVEVFYVLHYYLLENTVQRWYRIENTMISHLKSVGSNLS